VVGNADGWGHYLSVRRPTASLKQAGSPRGSSSKPMRSSPVDDKTRNDDHHGCRARGGKRIPYLHARVPCVARYRREIKAARTRADANRTPSVPSDSGQNTFVRTHVFLAVNSVAEISAD